METVIYSNKGGSGLVLKGGDKESDFVNPASVMLHGQKLKAGDYTTLDGMFSHPIRYAGILKDSEFTVMCFHTGDDESLFEFKKYYYTFYWIEENRIANCYSFGSVRDFFWRHDHWH